ncbi:glycosyltransferase [Idiomarina sp.]|uniref:glycosyltransferase family 4 protein n=1 Tax=Idiomarina sp. TaxID=1874361 RepID=UPI0026134CBA|nr:glycosyltransferase [Idiomarina sp.]
MERYIILDPGFDHGDSHHGVVNKGLLNAAPQENNVYIAASKHLPQLDWVDDENLVRHFDINMYPAGYHDLEPTEYRSLMSQYQAAFLSLFEDLALNSDDSLIVHTAFSYVYEGLARALMSYKKPPKAAYLSTMFAPGFVYEFGEEVIQSLREKLRHKFVFELYNRIAQRSKVEFIIDSPTQMYVDAYQSIWPKGDVKLHPNVCGAGKEKPATKLSDNKVLAYLGGPKWDKGLEFTAKALIELSKKRPDLDFYFHFNSDFPGSDVFQPIINNMLDNSGENVHIISGNLSPDNYERLLADMSCYLMLYEPELYGYKTSGVLWDVLRHAEGKSLVVSKNTWHERELIQFGARFTAIDYGNVDGLVNVFTANEELPTISSATYRNSYTRTLLGCFGEHVFKRIDDATNTTLQSEHKPASSTNKRLLVVRTNYGHFSELSGPGGFIKYMPRHGVDVEEKLVDLGHQSVNFENDGKRWQLLQSAQKHLKSYQVNSVDTERELMTNIASYDVVHFVDGEHSGVLTAMAKARGLLPKTTRLVVTFHQPDYVLKDLIVNPSFLAGFDVIQVMSPCQKKSFLDFGVSEEKVKVVPHGVAEEHFAPALPLHVAEGAKNEIKQLNAKFDSKKVILCVGNWLRDYDTFWEVAKQFRNVKDILFVAASRGLQLDFTADDKNVMLLNGGLSDRALHWLYRRAEILFLPLEGGAANNAVLEALAANCRIVTSNLPSTHYYLGDKSTYFDTVDDCIEIIGTLGSNAFVIENSIQRQQLDWPTVSFDMNEILYSFREN